MKGISKLGMTGILAFSFMGAWGQQINPITEAVMQNYAEILAQNPQDYMTLYDRASQYYMMGEYMRALSDLDMAIEYTPAKDTDYKLAAYSLKSDILTEQKNYDAAIATVNAALALQPNSQQELYKLGNLNLLAGNYEDALKAFQRLQRENPRSQEAFYGMAKSNAMLGRTQEAIDLIQDIEALGKQSYLTYCRIGDLYADMGKIGDATNNYVIAYTMADNGERPIGSLKFLSRKNPQAVMESLEGIINSNSDNFALNYVKAILAFDSGNYAKAEQACKELAEGLEEPSAAVYRMMAISQHAQDKADDARKSIAEAEKLAPGNVDVMIDKAEIWIMDNPEQSLTLAETALKSDPNNHAAQMIAAKAAIMTGNGEKATGLLNDLILSDPSNAEALLLRGYVNEKLNNDEKGAQTDYTRAGNVKTDDASNLVFAALGKAKSGKMLDAEGMIGDAAKRGETDRNTLYLIAVYYAQTGKPEKAKEYVEKALLNGYGNLYNLKSNNEPLINLTPVRAELGL